MAGGRGHGLWIGVKIIGTWVLAFYLWGGGLGLAHKVGRFRHTFVYRSWLCLPCCAVCNAVSMLPAGHGTMVKLPHEWSPQTTTGMRQTYDTSTCTNMTIICVWLWGKVASRFARLPRTCTRTRTRTRTSTQIVPLLCRNCRGSSVWVWEG